MAAELAAQLDTLAGGRAVTFLGFADAGGEQNPHTRILDQVVVSAFLRAGIQLSRIAMLSLSVTNVLDHEYQSFASRLPADGRSINLELALEW